LLFPAFDPALTAYEKMNMKELWKNALSTIEVEISKASFATFLSKTELTSLNQDTAVISCPNGLIAERIKKKYTELIKMVLRDLTGREYGLSFKVERRRLPLPEESDLGPLFTQGNKSDGLFPAYTFENFLVGPSNRLAHAAACSVAEELGTIHNPLFLYAGVGLGKTHLIHAIGNAIKRKDSKSKIYYCSAEHFTNELITAIQNRRTASQFKQKFRSVDLLMIDDVQFLAGREATQEEFFNTFNELYLAKKQIILTSDRHPREMKELEMRLVSRFTGGTVADIQSPDIELRIAILKQKAKERGMTLNEEVIFTLAERLAGSIRQLEGTLNQLLLLTQTHQESSLTDLVNLVTLNTSSLSHHQVSPETIIQKVCREFDVTREGLISPRRTKELVLPRQITMYLLRETAQLPLEKIGQLLGNRDHTTVLYGMEVIEKRLQNDLLLQNKVTSIKSSL